jgi:hypothetical protein
MWSASAVRTKRSHNLRSALFFQRGVMPTPTSVVAHFCVVDAEAQSLRIES